MKSTSRFARVVGVASLAAILVTGLAACGTPAGMNEDYLVLANVEGVDCSTVETPSTVANEMQATAAYVTEASPKQKSDILALNEGLESLDPLTAALDTKVDNCGGATLASDGGDVISLSPELKALLDAANVPLDEYSCEKIIGDNGGTVIDGTYTLFVNTLLEVDEGNLDLRQWSDALSTVLKGSTPDEMRSWLNRAICEEPVIGVSLAHLFAHLKVGDVSVLSLQTTNWLQPFAVEASEVNELVTTYTPLTDWRLKNFGKQDIPEDVYVAALKANHEYQEVASRLVFLLSRYQLAHQVMPIDSTHHYHLVAGGLTADGIPEVEISNEVDSRPALVFYLTEKTACKPISVLGFNTGDKRPMLGAIPESCEPLLPPPPTPPSECVKDCGSTPPPTCTVNCSPPPPPTCVTDCVKDWNKNPPKPDGVTPMGPGPLTPRPPAPATPAPVIPESQTPSSGSQAPGATTPNPSRPTPPPATGTDGGSVNPTPTPGATTPPVNEGDPGNPFG